jgi:hypothetical protein
MASLKRFSNGPYPGKLSVEKQEEKESRWRKVD